MIDLRLFAEALRDREAPTPPGLRAWNGSDPAHRFRVYRNNVAVTLVDALADSFPVVQALLGDAFFRAMARRYADAHPPESPVLAHYGSTFPDFVAAFSPALDLPYLAGVARLEWLHQNAYHSADAPTLTAEQLAPALADPERLPGLRLVLHPTAAPFSSRHPAVSLWSAHQHEKADEIAAHLATIAMDQGESAFVVRADLEVMVIPMAPGSVAFLTHLGDGRCLGEASESAQAADADFDLAQILGNALRAGLFSKFQLS